MCSNIRSNWQVINIRRILFIIHLRFKTSYCYIFYVYFFFASIKIFRSPLSVLFFEVDVPLNGSACSSTFPCSLFTFSDVYLHLISFSCKTNIRHCFDSFTLQNNSALAFRMRMHWRFIILILISVPHRSLTLSL